MTAKPTDLIAQRRRRDRVLLGSPLRPFLPCATADPSCHHEKAEAVGLVPETIVLVIAFQPNGVEMHVERVAELRILSLRLRSEEHVGRPAAAADENSSTVYAKETPAFRRRLRGDLADAEAQVLTI